MTKRHNPLTMFSHAMGRNVATALGVLCLVLLASTGCDADKPAPPPTSQPTKPPCSTCPAAPDQAAWGDWRGPGRKGIYDGLPQTLPAEPKVLWRVGLAAKSLGPVTATETQVIVSDKDELGMSDVWRCLDAKTGKELWTHSYDAPEKMDYTNAPRAAAVIEGDRVYLLGAFGDLYCVCLDNGQEMWSVKFREAFTPEIPTWGYCGTPLIVDDKLIVQTMAPAAAVVAIDKMTGKVVWKTPGDEPGYGALIVGTFGGKRQIVGHDRHTIGGWDVETGKRLWTVKPPEPNDYNVPTPIDLGDGRVLIATENNGTRIYAFNADGTIITEPKALHEDLLPDSSTPVVLDGRVWGAGSEGAYCLDLNDNLKTLWSDEDDPFVDYTMFVGGKGRVLIITKGGLIALMPSRPKPTDTPTWIRVFQGTPDGEPEVWSHPAFVDGRMYLRSRNEIVCLPLK